MAVERLLKRFKGREEALASIKRFKNKSLMFYRTDDLIHSRRVLWIARDLKDAILDTYGTHVDWERLEALALVHDDHETDTRLGDVPRSVKERMTREERAALDRQELSAIDFVTKRWPARLNGFSYRKLLLSAHYKNCLEAKLVSLADKTDASCEAYHEVLAGNKAFLRPVGNYIRVLAEMPEKFPALHSLLEQDHPLLVPPGVLSAGIFVHGTPHTPITLERSSDYPAYDRWVQLTKDHGEAGRLYTRRE